MGGVTAEEFVAQLRNYDGCSDGDVDEAADMLEFFFGQMQMHSPTRNGQHRYRFRLGGWPMTHCVGSSKVQAVRAATKEIRRARLGVPRLYRNKPPQRSKP